MSEQAEQTMKKQIRILLLPLIFITASNDRIITIADFIIHKQQLGGEWYVYYHAYHKGDIYYHAYHKGDQRSMTAVTLHTYLANLFIHDSLCFFFP